MMEREIQRRNGDRQRKGEKNTQRKIQTDKQQEKKKTRQLDRTKRQNLTDISNKPYIYFFENTKPPSANKPKNRRGQSGKKSLKPVSQSACV